MPELRIMVWFASVGMLLTGCDLGNRILERLPQQPSPSPQVQPSPTAAQSATTAEMENQVRERINEIRQHQGLVALRKNEKLAEVARNYSRRMAEQRFFAHVSPQGDTLSDRVKAAQIFYFVIGENLFTSTNILQPVPVAVKSWMNSKGHRENILRSEFRETGVGVWRIGNTYYFTQLFMRSL